MKVDLNFHKIDLYFKFLNFLLDVMICFHFINISPSKYWVDLFIFPFISVSWIYVLDAYWLGLEVRPCIGREGKISWFIVAIQISPLPRVSMAHDRGGGGGTRSKMGRWGSNPTCVLPRVRLFLCGQFSLTCTVILLRWPHVHHLP